ncbi:ATP-grasp domain-containing protein [Candidatus Kaiserbacteria bacterium]|nr:ATP-grasp domain-containing protein [Candidatus Kaiserbacteria bacterium]
MQKYRVAVLRGGPGEEYDISLQSGMDVLAALDTDRYQPLDVVITQSGEWLSQGRVRVPHELFTGIDAVFLALHGPYGENGRVQRLLDTLRVPYTGSRAFPSTMTLNKALAKDRLARAGVRMPRHMLVSASAQQNLAGLADSIRELFGPRYIVKPVDGSSSVGIAYAENASILITALAQALAAHEQVLIEEYIEGREATCGIIERFREQDRYAIPVMEIASPDGAPFIDCDSRRNNRVHEICPASFSNAEKRELERLARLVHDTLELSQYSHSDFIVADDGMYFIEANTLPRLTTESSLPKALTSVGSPYKDFINHLVEDTLEKRS